MQGEKNSHIIISILRYPTFCFPKNISENKLCQKNVEYSESVIILTLSVLVYAVKGAWSHFYCHFLTKKNWKREKFDASSPKHGFLRLIFPTQAAALSIKKVCRNKNSENMRKSFVWECFIHDMYIFVHRHHKKVQNNVR